MVMKIVAVVPSLPGGGAERVLSLLSLEWSKSHDVIVVAFDASKPAYEYGGRVVDLGLGSPSSVLAKLRVAVMSVVRLAGMFRREQPGCIVSFMEPANFPAALSAALTGLRRRLIVSVHHDPMALSKVRKVMIPLIYRLPFRVVAVSQGVRDALVSLGVPATRTWTIPNPVVTRSKVPQERSLFSSGYILGVGRLHRDKGFDRLLTAFSYIDQNDLHLVILGDGTERAGLIELANELGIENRVHFPGTVSNIETWYRHAECFVLSSRTEAWGMAIVEAMVNGCPVVSFRCDYGPAEIIEDHRSGILVENGNIVALTAAIRRVRSDDALSDRLAMEGKRTAAQFDVKDIARRWIMLKSTLRTAIE